VLCIEGQLFAAGRCDVVASCCFIMWPRWLYPRILYLSWSAAQSNDRSSQTAPSANQHQ